MITEDLGYFEIGIYRPKHWENVGTLWRSAWQLGAAGIFTIGAKPKRQITDVLREKLDHDKRYFYRVILTGNRAPDVRFDPSIISIAGQITDVIDNTVPDFDTERLLKEHSHDLISHYILTLSRPGATEREKKALSYGLAALLDPEG